METGTEHKHVRKPDPHRRHVFVWRFLYWPVRLIAWIKFGFVPVKSSVKGPFLLVSNHNTNWDPLLVATSFPREQMYYVSSEHIFRVPVVGKLIIWLQGPIARQKGGGAATTVMSMLRRLREGYNVAVFPEGNRSWDGVTNPFPPSIGKLAKKSGVTLVTYRLTGGYLASPRWAGNASRRGKMRGQVMGIYTPEELRAMTPDEVNEHIRADIHEDACADARKNPVVFKGRRLAEHMETLLFLCPQCGRTHTLQSHNDTVRCWKCGFGFRYLPTGLLDGKKLPFDNLRDANRWQTREIRRLCDEAGAEDVFSDENVYADEVFTARDSRRLGKGELRLYRDRLELPGVTLPLDGISGMSVMGPQTLYIGAGGKSYEVRSHRVCCMIKYVTAVSHLKGGADLGV